MDLKYDNEVLEYFGLYITDQTTGQQRGVRIPGFVLDATREMKAGEVQSFWTLGGNNIVVACIKLTQVLDDFVIHKMVYEFYLNPWE